ncbi:hypothetical protein PGT21_022419 [Puccinia graminis f. sp. tritici]|uniref:Uncharacterized protein n=1 Tax=Puccinia graminis f. sp. tritici TaxID=56615 RepID=A0A5B0QL79_PUCGR|nr:hypothetical protein PGT21_022419 [Puccinia graminis f. sp. tritici]KAA1113694.1 hypothetical protein PGTUg99_021047 [Puccinia graminis f. sp. tritici]
MELMSPSPKKLIKILNKVLNFATNQFDSHLKASERYKTRVFLNTGIPELRGARSKFYPQSFRFDLQCYQEENPTFNFDFEEICSQNTDNFRRGSPSPYSSNTIDKKQKNQIKVDDQSSKNKRGKSIDQRFKNKI